MIFKDAKLDVLTCTKKFEVSFQVVNMTKRKKFIKSQI
jgi:hypothetical protein